MTNTDEIAEAVERARIKGESTITVSRYALEKILAALRPPVAERDEAESNRVGVRILGDRVSSLAANNAGLRYALERAVKFIELMRVPQNIADAGWQVIQGKQVLESAQKALAENPCPAPVEELPLPDGEGWWWRWNETANEWQVLRVEYDLEDGDTLGTWGYQDRWLPLASGRWIKIPAPPSPAETRGEAFSVPAEVLQSESSYSGSKADAEMFSRQVGVPASPPQEPGKERAGGHEVELEVARFARDFYPQSTHESRMDHFLSEVEELKLATGWQEQVEEAADCALILFHIIEARGGVPLKAMLRKLAKARRRIETGEKTTRPAPSPPEPAGGERLHKRLLTEAEEVRLSHLCYRKGDKELSATDADCVCHALSDLSSLRSTIAGLETALAKAERFKSWTHAYLDSKGVPHHPPGTHGEHGCRIGDRMDWVWSEMDKLRSLLKEAIPGIRYTPNNRESWNEWADRANAALSPNGASQ